MARAKAEYEAEQAEIREAERQLGTPAESPVEPAAWHKRGRNRTMKLNDRGMFRLEDRVLFEAAAEIVEAAAERFSWT
ncbi:MAG TPA: hypothetical protein DE060_13230 [Lentisphaeria bacterium]|nr:hypothetical protein [Lentisphaeria bacterium]HCG50152.1 hypothetical protein [Lentisphaeria bacterium]